MLQQLVINDLAVINKLDLEFDTGMTVYTGETGAGKSILLDAIGLILGDRADTSLIRGSADKTDVTAVFSLATLADVKTKLAELEIAADDDELFIRRVVSKDGRSRAYLNNNPVPMQVLRDIGPHLIDIYGQHAHQSLSRPKTQRALLDGFGDYAKLLSTVSGIFQEWKEVERQLAGLQTGGDDYEARLTLLRYQIEELTELGISAGEYNELTGEHKRLSHAQELVEACQSALDELSNDDNAIELRLALHQRRISELTQVDQSLQSIAELLDNARIQTEEAVSELRDYVEGIDSDTSQLAQVEKRLDSFHDLARKHRVKPEQLPEHLEHLQTELEHLEHGQDHHDALQAQLQTLQTDYFENAAKLRKKRTQTASQLSAAVTDKMHELGIGGEFAISVDKINDDTPRQHGMDSVNFMVATNPGQPLRALNKVASGGELSRLSLAIQIIGSKDSGTPTLIFDEVDTGISGGIAEVVGRLLHSLATHHQIFCVTHLAQVASCGHHHFRVAKETQEGETFTHVEILDKSQRIDEIARMLAGLKITSESRANAKKMLEAV